MAEEMLDIADVHEDTQAARLQIDTRKWYLSKLAPKRYGDRLQQNIEHQPPQLTDFSDVPSEVLEEAYWAIQKVEDSMAAGKLRSQHEEKKRK